MDARGLQVHLSLSHHPSASWARARLLHYGIDTDGCGGGFKLLATLTTAPPGAILELDHQREIDFYTARGHLHNSCRQNSPADFAPSCCFAAKSDFP